MEKKKMTKAEAFEWFKNKKVYVDGYSAFIQSTLFKVGFKWMVHGTDVSNMEKPFLFFTEKGYIEHSDDMIFYRDHYEEEIKAEDILSLEIEDELEFSYDKVVELAEPLMQYLNEVGCRDSIRVSQYGIVHEPMSTLIFDNGIGE